MFCFELFLSGVDLKLRGAMASSSNDKEKTPPEDDTKDFRLKKRLKVKTRRKIKVQGQTP
jgi:hypothetical protein